jgi:hypothetical protein
MYAPTVARLLLVVKCFALISNYRIKIGVFMKVKTIRARMSAEKVNRNTVAARLLLGWLEHCDNAIKLRPCYYQGSGRYAKTVDHSAALVQLCDLLGLRYEIGNDAPRGGKGGAWVRIATRFDDRAEIRRAEAARIAEEARKEEERKQREAVSYERAKMLPLATLISAEEWRRATSNGKRGIAHHVAQSLGVLNDAGFRKALGEAMSEGGAEIWK